MNIRPYEPKDHARCREICYATSTGYEQDSARRALYMMYCDYYVENEPETCFVAVNDADEAVGYILCSVDYKKYLADFERLYMKRLLATSVKWWLVRKLDGALRKKVSATYPAYMHIDILPEGQRCGLGTRLVDALFSKLKEKNVPGVFLVCGDKNVKGCSFYRKYGFREYEHKLGCYTFVFDLDKGEKE